MDLDYLNQNSLRNYPVKDGLGRVSTDGLFTIPNTLIVDLSLSAAGINTAGFFISKITSTSASLSIEISVISGAVFGTFSTELPNTGENFDLLLVAGPNYPDAAGIITIGKTADLAKLPSGTFSFTYDSTKLLSRVSTVANVGLSRITFADNAGNELSYSGHVWIRANNNLQFARLDESTVLLNAGDGLGLNQSCSTDNPPITSINGIYPDTNGNFTLLPDDACVQITPVTYGILISDSCGKPCLGSSDISALSTRVNTLENDIYQLRDFINNLQAAINQANTLISFQCISP